MSAKRGFTMIEVIFVIIILGILAAIAIPKLAASRDEAKALVIFNNVDKVIKEAIAYQAKNGTLDFDIVNDAKWNGVPGNGEQDAPEFRLVRNSNSHFVRQTSTNLPIMQKMLPYEIPGLSSGGPPELYAMRCLLLSFGYSSTRGNHIAIRDIHESSPQGGIAKGANNVCDILRTLVQNAYPTQSKGLVKDDGHYIKFNDIENSMMHGEKFKGE